MCEIIIGVYMKVGEINCLNYRQNSKTYAVPRVRLYSEASDTLKKEFRSESTNISFKGWKWGGTVGSVIGTLAGVGLGAIATVATGGLAAPLLLGMGGAVAGGIGGDAIQQKIDDNYPHDSSSPDDMHGVDNYP